eukprot:1141676-Pelagomonas_calceolata.AAC.1
MKKIEVVLQKRGILLTERADLGIGISEQHIITDRRSTIGPNSLFNLKSVNLQPESGSVAKNVMGKIQVHVLGQRGIPTKRIRTPYTEEVFKLSMGGNFLLEV